MRKILANISGAAVLATCGAAFAQSGTGPLPTPAAPLPAEAAPATPGVPVVDEDNMADDLNKRQQLQQKFIFTRTVDGAVVETAEREVVYSRGDPVRTTESDQSAVDALAQKFDAEVLTKTEAFEEAKIDFVVADINRDGKLTVDEYLRLVETWRDTEDDAATPGRSARERQYRAFIEELEGSGETPPANNDAALQEKFGKLTNMTGTIARDDYYRAYLAEFDSVDENKDMMLRGEELMRFRALNRGGSM